METLTYIALGAANHTESELLLGRANQLQRLSILSL